MKNFFKNILFSPFYLTFYINFFYEKFLEIFLRKHLIFNAREKFKNFYTNDKIFISHKNSNNQIIPLTFFSPNWVSAFRAETFSTKEPETLRWIDKLGGKGTFFDIGANIGLYSIYYAKVHSGKVYSFEPSVFNLSLLSKNIFINNVQDNIKVISNPLSNKDGFTNFSFSNMDEGGAHNAFGVNFGTDGKVLKTVLNYFTLGFSLDYLIDNSIISDIPSMIKIDVDGIEHLVIDGAKKTIKERECKSILIEVNKKFSYQMKYLEKILKFSGFELENKNFCNTIEINSKEKNEFNQVWLKK